MKITLLTQVLSANVIAQTADEALRIFLTDERFTGAEIGTVQITRIQSPPNAATQAAEFAEMSGNHLPGYFPGLADALRSGAATADVWAVSVQSEWTAQFIVPQTSKETAGNPENIGGESPESVVGSIGGAPSLVKSPGEGPLVVDPNDRI